MNKQISDNLIGLQGRLDWQGICISSSLACLHSIRANTIDIGEPLSAEQFDELSVIYDRLLELQQSIDLA